MNKFEEVYDDVQELFDGLLDATGLDNHINVKLLDNSELKEIGKVTKANEILKHMTNVDVIVVINGSIFEKLELEQKKMVVEELLARIHFDTEKGKMVITTPDVKTYSLLLRKYGYDKYEVLNESIKTLFQEKLEEEAA
jgi:hypothetical protein